MSKPTDDVSNRALKEYIVKHPAFLRYLERPHCLRTKDDCRGYQLVLCLLLLEKRCPEFACWVARAVTYLWSVDVWNAIPPAPPDCVAVMPHTEPLLFLYGGGGRLAAEAGSLNESLALLVCGPNKAYGIMRAGGLDERGPAVGSLDDIVERLYVRHIAPSCPVLASRLAFLTSPCVMKAELRGERGLRRSVQRALGHADDDPVYEVVLRRPRSQGVSANAAAHVEWSCQWAVRAHWRRLASGRLILVHPYWKGPPDKPLARRHYRVER